MASDKSPINFSMRSSMAHSMRGHLKLAAQLVGHVLSRLCAAMGLDDRVLQPPDGRGLAALQVFMELHLVLQVLRPLLCTM